MSWTRQERDSDSSAEAEEAAQEPTTRLEAATAKVGQASLQRRLARRMVMRKKETGDAKPKDPADEKYREQVGDEYYQKTKDMNDTQRKAFFKEEEYRLQVGDAFYEKTKGMSDPERKHAVEEE